MKNLKNTLFVLVLTIISCSGPAPKVDSQKKTNIELKMAVRIDSLRPSLWVYGMMQPNDAENSIVAGWYGFNFDIRGGCVTPQDNEKEEHNRKTDSILTARIGKDWEKRFNKSVDSLYNIDTSALAIAQENSFVKDFYEKTEKFNEENKVYAPSLEFYCHPTLDDNIKAVILQGGGVNKHSREFHYLTITVDLEKKKVINIDKTVYALW